MFPYIAKPLYRFSVKITAFSQTFAEDQRRYIQHRTYRHIELYRHDIFMGDDDIIILEGEGGKLVRLGNVRKAP